jgi:hypothetical protein
MQPGIFMASPEVAGANCQSIGGCGTVYKLSTSNNGAWTDAILYSFCSTGNPNTCPDGAGPLAGLISDKSGNLLGTTYSGGTNGLGVIFRLSPPQQKVGSWTQTVLWSFNKQQGCLPGAGKLNIDTTGNIFGTTTGCGRYTYGVVFELSPNGTGTYTYSVIHNFSGPDGIGPDYGVAMDGADNLYGTTQGGGPKNSECTSGLGGCGVVYQLTRSGSKWTERVIYKFLGGTKGMYPISPVWFDQAGNLYATFAAGGQGTTCWIDGCGGILKLIPKAGGGTNAYLFFFDGQNGGTPRGGVLPVSTTELFGTTQNLTGTVFRLQGKTETVLYTFCSLPNCTDGATPASGTLTRRGRAIYGVTVQGGHNGAAAGVFYNITP